MNEVDVRKALRRAGHLLAARLSQMPKISRFGAEIVIAPPYEIALSVVPLERSIPGGAVEEAPKLTPTEEAIIGTASKVTPRKGSAIARRAGLEYNSYFRGLLKKLVEAGRLKRAPENAGYLLT